MSVWTKSERRTLITLWALVLAALLLLSGCGARIQTAKSLGISDAAMDGAQQKAGALAGALAGRDDVPEDVRQIAQDIAKHIHDLLDQARGHVLLTQHYLLRGEPAPALPVTADHAVHDLPAFTRASEAQRGLTQEAVDNALWTYGIWTAVRNVAGGLAESWLGISLTALTGAGAVGVAMRYAGKLRKGLKAATAFGDRIMDEVEENPETPEWLLAKTGKAKRWAADMQSKLGVDKLIAQSRGKI